MSVWSSMVVGSDHPSCRCLHVVSLVSCSFAIVVSTCPNHTCLIMFAKVLLSCMLHATFPSFSIIFHHFPSIFYPFLMFSSSFFSFPKRSICESQDFDVAPTVAQRSPYRESLDGGRGGVFESHGRSVPLSASHRLFFLTGFDVEKPAESLRKAWKRGPGEAGEAGEQSLSREFAKSRSIAKHREARHAKNIQDPRSKEACPEGSWTGSWFQALNVGICWNLETA